MQNNLSNGLPVKNASGRCPSVTPCGGDIPSAASVPSSHLPQGEAQPLNGLQAQSVSPSELEQFEEFKKIKLMEQTRARIAKVECDCLSSSIGRAELRSLCREAERLALGGIVVLPVHVKMCVVYLGDDPRCSLIAPVSYPHGGDSTEGKIALVKRAVRDGVDEVEVYAPFSAIRESNMAYVRREFKKLARAVRPRALRIVLDCSVLREEEVVRACNCAADCGVNVVRLVNAGGLSAIISAKSALRDRCLLKADGNTLSAMEEAEALGASLINCNGAVELCSRLLSCANN